MCYQLMNVKIDACHKNSNRGPTFHVQTIKLIRRIPDQKSSFKFDTFVL